MVINDKFAQFSESLLIAQEVAREGISARIKERERQQRIEKAHPPPALTVRCLIQTK